MIAGTEIALGRETARLAAAAQFKDFDFDLSKNLQGILKLAADIYETPAAFITLISEQDQWFKVTRGFEVERMPRAGSFCTHTIAGTNAMIVEDALEDKRFSHNPLVHHAPNIRFYAGAPLSTQGQNIGTLCVMDTRVKVIDENKRALLEILAGQAMHLMELERTHKLLSEKMTQIEKQNEVLSHIAFVQSHEFRGPLCTIMGLMNMIKEEKYCQPEGYLVMMEEAVQKLDEKIHKVVESTHMANRVYLA